MRINKILSGEKRRKNVQINNSNDLISFLKNFLDIKNSYYSPWENEICIDCNNKFKLIEL